jgi:hypothetical protein
MPWETLAFTATGGHTSRYRFVLLNLFEDLCISDSLRHHGIALWRAGFLPARLGASFSSLTSPFYSDCHFGVGRTAVRKPLALFGPTRIGATPSFTLSVSAVLMSGNVKVDHGFA